MSLFVGMGLRGAKRQYREGKNHAREMREPREESAECECEKVCKVLISNED